MAWDQLVGIEVTCKMADIDRCLREEGNPVCSRWMVDPAGSVEVWTDASSLGVALTVDGDTVEDGSWLCEKDDFAHINLAELDAVVKGLNLAIRWGFWRFTIVVDSATVVGWLCSVINRIHNVTTEALNELLVRCRLTLLQHVIVQEKLALTKKQVSSETNIADALTRIPRK